MQRQNQSQSQSNHHEKRAGEVLELEDARQGSRGARMWTILVVSLALAILGFIYSLIVA